jgi:hypothetical protein
LDEKLWIQASLGFVMAMSAVACGGSSAETHGSQVSAASGASGENSTGGQGGSLNLNTGAGGSSGGSTMTGGTPGAGGAPTSLGGSLSTGGGGGAMPSIALHQCPTTPEPSCPTKVLERYNQTNPSDLEGVTEVKTALNIYQPEELAALSCLETVDDDLMIDVFSPSQAVSFWPLRNLQKTGGGVEVSAGLTEAWVDCGFSRLTSLGSVYITGGAIDLSDLSGKLDLSSVKAITHIRINRSNLTQVTLPSNAALTMGQLWFDTNPNLTTVDGFTAVMLTQSGIQVTGAQSVRIVNNPQLSTCRANQLQQLFLAAGFPAADMVISGNLPSCQ